MRWACHVFCAIAAAISVLLGIEMFNTSPVLTFGDPAKSCMRALGDTTPCTDRKIAELAPGDILQMCFGDITWFRIVPSRGRMYFFDKDNMRHDLDDKIEPVASHVISLPAKIGLLEPKCRISKMPAGIPPGPAILTGTLTSTDTFLGVTRIVTIPYPRMPFIAKAAQ
jgi:hypothetical protein